MRIIRKNIYLERERERERESTLDFLWEKYGLNERNDI